MSKDDINTLLAETDLSKKHSVEEVSNILWEQFDLQNAQIYTEGIIKYSCIFKTTRVSHWSDCSLYVG